MHHYPHHIGDYRAHTVHLTMVEDGAYRRLLDIYYMHEKPLPADVVAVQRIVGARTREERGAVETVLREFFTLEDDGWHQSRADEEIGGYQARAEIARENGKRSAGRPKTGRKPTGKPTDNQVGYSTDTQTKPSRTLTVNQEPRTKNQETTTSFVAGIKSAREGSVPRAKPIPQDWLPSESVQNQLVAARPDLTDEIIQRRMVSFRTWCAAKNITTFNPDATWLGFMVDTHANDRKNTDERSTAAALAGLAAAGAR